MCYYSGSVISNVDQLTLAFSKLISKILLNYYTVMMLANSRSLMLYTVARYRTPCNNAENVLRKCYEDMNYSLTF